MSQKDKVDIGTLLAEGIIDDEKAQELKERIEAQKEKNGSPVLNLLIIIGALSIIAGFLGLNPNPHLGVAFAVFLMILGYGIYFLSAKKWVFVAKSFGIIGCLGVCSWLFFISNNNLTSATLVSTILIGIVACTLNSKFLVALLPITISWLIDSATGYFNGVYYISVKQPSISVILYAAMTVAGYAYILKEEGPEEKSKNIGLIRVFGRTCFIFLNLSFWVGSIFGDDLSASALESYPVSKFPFVIPEYAFSIGWALILLTGTYMGGKFKLGFITNTSIVFFAIHFYTQFFETLGANPLSLLIGGLLMFSSVLAWWRYNKEIIAKINKISAIIGR